MTQLVQTRKVNQSAFAGVALAAALLGGIVGGAVATRIQPLGISGPVAPQSVAAPANAGQAAQDATWLEYGRAWEERYRQMYPNSR